MIDKLVGIALIIFILSCAYAFTKLPKELTGNVAEQISQYKADSDEQINKLQGSLNETQRQLDEIKLDVSKLKRKRPI